MRSSQRGLSQKRLRFWDLFKTPIGYLTAFFYTTQEGDVFLTRIVIGGSPRRESARRAPLPEEIKTQFYEYLEGERRCFNVSYILEGTPFDRRVWQTLLRIPYGETRTYLWLAEQVGQPRGARAVGGALSRNPLPIVIPCHRIIYSDGSLGGYTAGVDIKRRLLEIEFYGSL